MEFLGDIGSFIMTPLYYAVSVVLVGWHELFGRLFGEESGASWAFSIVGLENGEADEVTVRADDTEFRAVVRLDTPREREYLRHGGILPYVLRRLLTS